MHVHMHKCNKRSKALKKLLILKCHVFGRQEIAGANITWRPSKSSSFEHISGDLVLSCSITYYLLAEAWFTHCTWQTYASEKQEVWLEVNVFCRISTHLLQRWRQMQPGTAKRRVSRLLQLNIYIQCLQSIPESLEGWIFPVLSKMMKPSTMRDHPLVGLDPCFGPWLQAWAASRRCPGHTDLQPELTGAVVKMRDAS